MGWENIASLPSARAFAGAAAPGDGYLYVVCGLDSAGAEKNTVYRYDPAANAWSTRATLYARSLHAVVAQGGYVWSFGGLQGGYVITDTYRYDPASNAWLKRANMPSGRQDAIVAASGDYLYLFGGINSSGTYTDTTYRYDPVANSWTAKASMSASPRADASAVTLPDGRILIIGGRTSNTFYSSYVQVYDPATDTFTPKASLPAARAQSSAALGTDGLVYVFGGRDSGTYTDTTYRYDPAANTWETLAATLNTQRSAASSAVQGSVLYVVGGQSALSTTEASAESYTLNQAPNAATLTTLAGGESIDRANVNRASHTFSDPDAGDSQSKFDHRFRLVGSSTWTTATETTPNQYVDYPAGTFAAGDYERQVRTYDAQGVQGPWSASGFFTAADAPAAPTITAPVSGATVSSSSATVTWSTPNQDAYQVQVLDGSTVVSDTGQVTSSTTRTITQAFPTNNVARTIQVRVRYGGLWSQWYSITVNVSFTPPEVPVVTLTPDAATGTLLVGITNPAPGAGVPATSYNDVYVDDGDGEERRATMLAPNSTWTYWTPKSGRDYDGKVRVVAVGSNGTTASS